MTGLNTETRGMKKEEGFFITLHMQLQLNRFEFFVCIGLIIFLIYN